MLLLVVKVTETTRFREPLYIKLELLEPNNIYRFSLIGTDKESIILSKELTVEYCKNSLTLDALRIFVFNEISYKILELFNFTTDAEFSVQDVSTLLHDKPGYSVMVSEFKVNWDFSSNIDILGSFIVLVTQKNLR